MSDTSRKVNRFFQTATRADVDSLLSKVILSERQERVFSMFYLKRNDINFIADTIYVSRNAVEKELTKIRRKLAAFL